MAVLDASYGEIVGASIEGASQQLSERWLGALVALMPVDPQSVFSTSALLDHIPCLIQEIGKFVGAPANEDIAAKSIVIDKARELGQLRHRQHASVHQVLREYDLLGDVLEQFLIEQTHALALVPAASECLDVSHRLNRAVRILMQITVETFISQYTETITEQARRLDGFNRAVSHELRNVLGTLQFGAVLLDTGNAASDEPTRQRLVGTLRRNTERAVKIIRSFERLPRSGIVADKPTEQTVEMADLVQEVFRQLQEMADARGVELRLEGQFPLLYLDSGALELVLVNLISNAIKYSDRQKTLRFVEISGHDSQESYDIRVRDNGIGIPANAVDGVFERFVRAHPELDDELGIEGTGLGLAIVDECVKSLSGKIRLESEEGVGTTFILVIPKRLPSLPSEPPDAGENGASPSPSGA
jgi:signal transduction histidine kinase